MSHKNKVQLFDQVKNCYDEKLAIGRSKHDDKLHHPDADYIYSWDTYRSYLKQAGYFVAWVKEQPAKEEIGHKARTLAECRPYVEEWLQSNIDRGLSPYTIKLQAAAMAKLYGCSIPDFNIKTPSREREGITRSRKEAVRDVNWNESLHSDFVAFCRSTGLRRSELEQIRGSDLIEKDGKYYLNITRGTKGGRPRVSPIAGTPEEIAATVAKLRESGNEKVYPQISTNADIHSYRADYATRIYNAVKRPESDFRSERLIIFKNHVIAIYGAKNGYKKDFESYSRYYGPIKDAYGNPKMLPGYKDVSSRYVCRKDLATVVYDRLALFAASNALGHNRECVVAEHYIRA